MILLSLLETANGQAFVFFGAIILAIIIFMVKIHSQIKGFANTQNQFLTLVKDSIDKSNELIKEVEKTKGRQYLLDNKLEEFRNINEVQTKNMNDKIDKIEKKNN